MTRNVCRPMSFRVFVHPVEENTMLRGDGRIFRGTRRRHDGVKTLPPPPPWRDFRRGARELKGRTYRASEKEIELVNAALYLRRPLLVTGRPGVGKTSLAYAVAWELKLGEVLPWPINTRSTLQQGLYDYDAIARVRDASIESRAGKNNGSQTPPDIGRYLRLGPLGTALLGGPDGQPRVLLVDEIDKSDIDLPNDLLNSFEEGEFTIPELKRAARSEQTDVSVSTADRDTDAVMVKGGRIRCKAFPFVVLTSNQEREFPPAFLRRCVHLQILPPDHDELMRIVEARLEPEISTEAAALVEEFLRRRDASDLATDHLLNA